MRRPQKQLLAIFSAFMLPLLLALLIRQFGWYQSGVSSHGQWLKPAQQLDNYPIGKWALVQYIDKSCDARCLDDLKLLDKAWLALGADRSKTHKLLLGKGATALNYGDFIYLNDASFDSANEAHQWFVVDPTGWVILRYQPKLGAVHARGMIQDLKKLIKNSRFRA